MMWDSRVKMRSRLEIHRVEYQIERKNTPQDYFSSRLGNLFTEVVP